MARKRYTARFKAKVAFEVSRGDKSINEIASEYGIHPQQVRAWKREFCKRCILPLRRTETP